MRPFKLGDKVINLDAIEELDIGGECSIRMVSGEIIYPSHFELRAIYELLVETSDIREKFLKKLHTNEFSKKEN